MKAFLLGVSFFLFSLFPAYSQELLLCFPEKLPPWTFSEKNTGIMPEIVRQALPQYKISTCYITLSRLNMPLGPEVDAHVQVEAKGLEGYYSDPVMEFFTDVISLKSRELSLIGIKDLQNLSVVAFPNARKLFGPEFSRMARENPNYKEMVKQENQVALLFAGRVDAIIVDKSVFGYFRRNNRLVSTSSSVTRHQVKGLTGPSPAFAVFSDKKLRDEFNKGLARLRNSGRYATIVKKYLP